MLKIDITFNEKGFAVINNADKDRLIKFCNSNQDKIGTLYIDSGYIKNIQLNEKGIFSFILKEND